jgi:uncharacterized integral membrane protein
MFILLKCGTSLAIMTTLLQLEFFCYIVLLRSYILCYPSALHAGHSLFILRLGLLQHIQLQLVLQDVLVLHEPQNKHVSVCLAYNLVK